MRPQILLPVLQEAAILQKRFGVAERQVADLFRHLLRRPNLLPFPVPRTPLLPCWNWLSGAWLGPVTLLTRAAASRRMMP